MDVRDAHLAGLFEEHRARLRAVAYRMLGSFTEADDAVQETWLRASRAAHEEVENVGGWLTTICARVCLNMLRSRGRRREQSLDVHLPDPVVSPDELHQPHEEAVLVDSVGIAMLVVLDALGPAERVAFVLHDMFQIPYEAIASVVDRSPTTTRQLASRARRRVRDAAVRTPDPDLARQREAVDAFLQAARGGDFKALIAVLDPDVVLRADFGAWRPALSRVVRGAEDVARQAITFAIPHADLHPALVGGAAGVVVTVAGQPSAVMGFVVAQGRIVEIDAISDPERVPHLAASVV